MKRATDNYNIVRKGFFFKVQTVKKADISINICNIFFRRYCPLKLSGNFFLFLRIFLLVILTYFLRLFCYTFLHQHLESGSKFLSVKILSINFILIIIVQVKEEASCLEQQMKQQKEEHAKEKEKVKQKINFTI